MSISMSMMVDDTFAFMHQHSQDVGRQRVDSDALSFYFWAPTQSHSHMMQPYSHLHCRPDSTFSVMSVTPPPISLHNWSFGTHRHNDSNTSANSMAVFYDSVNGRRVSWARHHQDRSVDSAMSDFSAQHLGCPGLVDKMLESALDCPLKPGNKNRAILAVGTFQLVHWVW